MGSDAMGIRDGVLGIELADVGMPVERTAAELLVREVKERTGVSVRIGARDAGCTLVLGTVESAEAREYAREHPTAGMTRNDGFHIDTRREGSDRIYVIGGSASGVVAGVGKLLRLSDFRPGEWSVPKVDITVNPAMSVRGMYFATHFGNFYEAAPFEEVDRVIEDLALWGTNSLMVWFDMHQFTDFNDPAARKHLKRLQHIGETAHRVGMKLGIGCLANEGYGGSPVHLRIPVRNPGNYGVELCPSIPEAMDIIEHTLEEVATSFPALDAFWIWPYDQGGCWCEKCKPWGGNGYLRASERIAIMYKRHFPNAEIWLSTWKMDYFGHMQGEIDGVKAYLRDKKPEWLTGIITGQDEYQVQKPLLDRPNPKRYPLASFPEISMYGMAPWGGFGATCLPHFNEKVIGLMAGFTDGGWPYSEGIYEDLSKFQWVQSYWNPKRATDDVLREYASYYLGRDSAEDFVKLAHALEDTHIRGGWSIKKLSRAGEAWSLAQAIDSRLSDWSRKHWRWRLLFDRAAIDDIVKEHGVRSLDAQKMLKPYCDEVTEIYHAQHTELRPPDFPEQVSPENVAYGKRITTSSTLPEYAGCEPCLVDGFLSQHDPQNFWVNDPSKEERSWVMIDLGADTAIKEVKLQFRNIDGKFWFIPSDVTFLTSQDGSTFTPVSVMFTDRDGNPLGPFVTCSQLPKEDSPYSPAFWCYRMAGGARGRYLRIDLGKSQHQDAPYVNTVELTEIEVIGKN